MSNVIEFPSCQQQVMAAIERAISEQFSQTLSPFEIGEVTARLKAAVAASGAESLTVSAEGESANLIRQVTAFHQHAYSRLLSECMVLAVELIVERRV